LWIITYSHINSCALLVFQWQHRPAEIMAQGQAIIEALNDASKHAESGGKSLPVCRAAIHKCFSTLASTYDRKMGGFGRAPKFPQPGWKHPTVCRCVFLLYREPAPRDSCLTNNV